MSVISGQSWFFPISTSCFIPWLPDCNLSATCSWLLQAGFPLLLPTSVLHLPPGWLSLIAVTAPAGVHLLLHCLVHSVNADCCLLRAQRDCRHYLLFVEAA